MSYDPLSSFLDEPADGRGKLVSRKQPAYYRPPQVQANEASGEERQDTPVADLKAQEAAFLKIRNLVNECPAEYLIELFKRKTGSDFIPDFVAADISGSLSSLEQMAALGHQDAVENLVAIATRIAGFLDHLAGSPEDKVQKNVDEGKFTHCDIDEHRCWRQDYRDLSVALRVLVKVPAKELRKISDTLDTGRLPVCKLPDGIGMFTRSLHPFVLKQIEIPPERDSSRQALPEEESLEELDMLLARLLEYRAQHLAREAARKATATAETWPIPVPALVDGRAERIEKRLKEIGLGSGLGYDLTGTPLGAPRKIEPHENTGKVYQIFLKLDRERKAALKMNKSHREAYENYESRQIQQASDDEAREDAATRRLREFHEWDSRTHWERNAALLPSPSIEHVKSGWMRPCYINGQSRLMESTLENWEDPSGKRARKELPRRHS